MPATLTVVDDLTADRPKDAVLAPETMDALGVELGDALGVEGRRRTVTRAVPSDQVRSGAVTLGPGARRSADVAVGEAVTVDPASAPPARRVVVAPAESISVRGGEAAVRRALDGAPLVVGDRVPVSLLGGSLAIAIAVVELDPAGPATLGADTEVVVQEDAPDSLTKGRRVPAVDVADVAGLDDQVEQLRDLLGLPIRHGADLADLGQRSSPGVLVHGPAGVGKTMLVSAVAAELPATFLPVRPATADAADGPELEAVAGRARRRSPAVVFVDDLDGVGGGDGGSAADRRLVARVRALADDLRAARDVVLVGAATDPTDVPEPLRRGGRFGREVELPAPDTQARAAILRVHADDAPLATDVDLDSIARRTHGYVGADLASLVSTAILTAASRHLDGTDGDAALPPDATVEMADFEAALSTTEPSAMRGLTASVPDVSYDDVGGLDAAKRELVRTVEWPLRHRDLFERMGATAPTGVLLYGPPGTGKTLLARAVANATEANFVSVGGPELLDKYVGESERAVRDVFDRAREMAPSLVFFDEIDALTPERQGDAGGGSRAPERVVSQLLTEIDGLEPLDEVTLVGATNRPDRIDPALLRPGRFERLVEVPLPDREARAQIFAVHTRDVPLGGVDLGWLADQTEGYTGSDVEAVVREAALLAVETALDGAGGPGGDPRVERAHFERALDRVDPSVSPERRDHYERLDPRGPAD
ncbi:MAG: AAA family ATPase [Halobacteriaceae archaeon]